VQGLTAAFAQEIVAPPMPDARLETKPVALADILRAPVRRAGR